MKRGLWVIVAVAAVTAGCSSGGTIHRKPEASAPSVHPFTGLKGGTGAPVLIAKIDNTHPALPQAGVRDADIVYAEQVEGGETRLMAVFSSRRPARIGPVRSARISDLHLIPQFGRPAFAYSGAQHKLLPEIAKAPLYDVSPGHAGGAYSRDGARRAPYNLFANPRKLLDRAPAASRPKDIGFRFGAAPPGGTAASTYTVRYPATRFTFDWSRTAGKWRVSMNGATDRAAEGGRLGAPTIVVQWCQVTRSRFHDFLGNYTPLIRTVGTGTGVVLRDGRTYQVRWSRPNETQGTTYTTTSGRRMTFHTGQVWVLLASKKPRVP